MYIGKLAEDCVGNRRGGHIAIVPDNREVECVGRQRPPGLHQSLLCKDQAE